MMKRRALGVICAVVAPAVLLHVFEAFDLTRSLVDAISDTPSMMPSSPLAPSERLARAGHGTLGLAFLLVPLGLAARPSPRRSSVAAALVALGLAGLAAAGARFAYLATFPPDRAPSAELYDAFLLVFSVEGAMWTTLAAAVLASAVLVSLPERPNRLMGLLAILAWLSATVLAPLSVGVRVRWTRIAWGVYFGGDPLEVLRHALFASTAVAAIAMSVAIALRRVPPPPDPDQPLAF